MLNLRTRAFIFSLTLLILLVLAGFTNVANAESSKRVRKKTTTITTIEAESDDVDDEELPDNQGAPEREGVMTAVFGGSSGQSGLAGCKTDNLSKNLIKDLKADCQAWVKDQKAELKKRFLTSSCEESCEDCGMSLKRCHVNGTVKYLLK